MPGRVFQIAWDQTLLRIREFILRQNGFAVVSVFGAAQAREQLADDAPFDVFMVGWSTSHKDRIAMVAWLKERWPKIPVVAIHDSFQRPIAGADVTATHDTPEEWLAAVVTASRSNGDNKEKPEA
jgi:DNA-binding NtrC family response regulator